MTSENNKKSWIFTSLIIPTTAGIIAGIAVEIFTTLSVFMPILNGVLTFLSLFVINLPIPVWLLICIVMATSAATYFIIGNSNSDQQLYKLYTFDRILGIDWQWSWYMGDISTLIPLCPECAYEPEIDREHVTVYRDGSRVICDNCGFSNKWDMPPPDLKKRVIKEIHRRLRTGEFEKKLIEN